MTLLGELIMRLYAGADALASAGRASNRSAGRIAG